MPGVKQLNLTIHETVGYRGLGLFVSTSTTPTPPAATFYILLESGDRLLLESGDKFLKEDG